MAQRMRAGVGAVVMDHSGRVLLLERSDVEGAWQFPQGGLEENEEPAAAIMRELGEETGLQPDELEFLAVHPDWLAYELPEGYRNAKTGRGQVQRWFLYQLVRGDSSLDLPSGGEFSTYSWRTPDDVISHVVDFRQGLYRRVLRAFGPFMNGSVLDERGYDYAKTEFMQTSRELQSNEEMGERRLGAFLTFVGLSAAAVGLIADRDWEDPNVPLWVAFGASLAALAIGMVTFRRLVKRNAGTTGLMITLNRQREILSRGRPEAAKAAAYPELPSHRVFGTPLASRGLAETAAMINSALAGAAGALLVAALNGPGWVAALAILLAVPVWFTHWCIASSAYASVNRELTRLGVSAESKESKLPAIVGVRVQRFKHWCARAQERV